MAGEPRTERCQELAEQVCLLYGWGAAMDEDSDRALALELVWREWLREYEAAGGIAGGKGVRRAHPELSDERIAVLAAARRREKAEFKALVDRIVVEVPSGG